MSKKHKVLKEAEEKLEQFEKNRHKSRGGLRPEQHFRDKTDYNRKSKHRNPEE